MYDTPETPHLNDPEFRDVYPVSEDTFILLDALEKDVEYIKSLTPAIVLEIGTGSGCVTSFIAKIIESYPSIYFSTDINPQACLAAAKTATINKTKVDIINCSLCEPLKCRMANMVDICLFNPPYVPTTEDEITKPGIYTACNGGPEGRSIIDKFLPVAVKLLSENGLLYMVCIELNDPMDIIKSAYSKYGLYGSILLKRKAGIEIIYVIIFSRIKRSLNAL